MTLAELITRYEDNRPYFLTDQYNESQLRVDFLDPLFELLGWDINNTRGLSTHEREVLVEESLREDYNSNTKKPDYTFRLFSERKFYLEAKKPAVQIDVSEAAAQQVRSYGFTAKLKISVLSNFEYLAIYDCSRPVEPGDSVRRHRVKLYHYTQYADNIDLIKEEIGRESVYSGAFEDAWRDIELRIQQKSIDEYFLEQINRWRIILGGEIVSHSPDIGIDRLNDSVQSYINSIIFLRVCEDRNLEIYKRLLSHATDKNFDALLATFEEADRKYNAGLFSNPLAEDVVRNSSSAFWSIISELYYPTATYSFTVFASDILGRIYEIFLSEQLIVGDDEVKLVKKPDHIDRDIVTTPTAVIRDILRQTVSKFCEDKSDEEIFSSNFGDIACGSGAFLLETYQLLHDTLVDYYLINNRDNLVQIGPTNYKLTFVLKRRILEECIYGVDKDFNAVEACKFGLLLKLLEGEVNESIPIPALPNLDNNIFFGNSLLNFEEVLAEDRATINPYNFNDLKFDVIVGNPPYMSTEHMKDLYPLEYPKYIAKFNTAYRQFDKYFLFIERGMELLKPDGYLGYIVPNKFTKVGAAKMLRRKLQETGNLSCIVSFGANQLFKNKTTYTCLLILQNKVMEVFNYLEVYNYKNWMIRNVSEDDFDTVLVAELEDDGWAMVPGFLKPIFERILAQSITLEDLVGNVNISNGIQTSGNRIYVHEAIRESEEYFYIEKNGTEWAIEKQVTRPYFQTASGSDRLNSYRVFRPNSFVIYPYTQDEDGVNFIDSVTMATRFPETWGYLNFHKADLEKRDIQPEPETEHEWYRYGRNQALETCDVPAKIVVGVLSQGYKYAIDYNHTLISSGGTAGYCMITLPEDSPYSIYYIQAILSSKYLEWFSSIYGEVFRGGYIARGTKVLKRLPIREINFNVEQDKNIHDEIVSLQMELIATQTSLDLHVRDKRRCSILLRQFAILSSQLDAKLKTLYGLLEDDELVPIISKIYATD